MLNLYEILQKVLNESVSEKDVIDSINNHNYVDVTYDDGKYHITGKRLIQPYAYGLSKAGNPCLRAFQIEGDTLRGEPKWKTFLISNFTSWRPRRQTFNIPPPMQGYEEAPDYNRLGDRSMSTVFLQATFDNFDDTLSAAKAKTQFVKGAPKLSKKNTQGPMPNASQQRKRNVFTSQPNSQRYAQYARNINTTEPDFNRFDNDIWAKAEAEKQQQDNMKLQNSAKQPVQNQQGPLNAPKNKKEDNDNE